MVKDKLKASLVRFFGSFLLAGILAVAGDLMLAWQGMEVKCSWFLLAGAALTGFFYILPWKKASYPLKTGAGLLVAACIFLAALLVCWKTFSDTAAFRSLDQGKSQLYSGRKVMLITPHQDDDINVLGGVMEEYVRYGSEVYPVFVTNGDGFGLAEERFRETLEVCDYIGIPQGNVIFLGYGDTWQEGGPHIYNGQPGQVITSAYGSQATYGTQAKMVWAPGTPYTVEKYLGDLEEVIRSVRPDVIFCSDYDIHIDHRAVTMAFEKVMGRILKEDVSYRPLVFKGYAYSTAWYADADFYAENLLSTYNVFEEPYRQTPAVYRWDQRVRLPVWDAALSRSVFTSEIYRTLALYGSQEAHFRAARIINGDKVFWYRDTDSLCLDAQVTVSSADGELLRDYMLLENLDLANPERMPYDGVWIPDDPQRTAEITFPEARDVTLIRLYDHPSPEHNVLAGTVIFSDGSRVEFGPLDPGGAAVCIRTDKAAVTGFTVQLTQVEGSEAGLTEIEAFDHLPEPGMRYVKLMDDHTQFVYDYRIPEGSEAELKIYAPGLSEEELEQLELSWDNQKCWARRDGENIRVIVPQGKTMVLTLSVPGTDISDTVSVSNPGKLTRLHTVLGQKVEQQVFQKYCDGAHRNSAVYKLLMTVLSLI